MVFQLADSPTIIWASEVLPTTIRAKGIGLAIFSMMTGFITFSAPGGLAFKNLQWGMFLIFAGLCVIAAIIIYFFIPEVRARHSTCFGSKVDEFARPKACLLKRLASSSAMRSWYILRSTHTASWLRKRLGPVSSTQRWWSRLIRREDSRCTTGFGLPTVSRKTC
jgi:hypothetical protein